MAPAVRFAEEAGALRPLAGRPAFDQLRDLVRKVLLDCVIDLDTNSYSVPWRLIGETVQVVVLDGRVVVRHAGKVVADHAVCAGRRRIVDRAHLVGVVGASGPLRLPVPRLPRCCDPWPYTRRCGRRLVIKAINHETLVAHLDRLKLTAIRDQLDTLDEAARSKMNLREALAFLVAREIAWRDYRRI